MTSRKERIDAPAWADTACPALRHRPRAAAISALVGLLFACKGSPSAPGDAGVTVGGPPVTTILGRVDGNVAAEWVGYSVGAAGDVNGDGISDFLVGSLSASNGGRIGVVLGPFGDSFKINQADVVIDGEDGFNNAGENLTEAGGCDFDGDGIKDLIIGSPFADRRQIGSVQTSGDNVGRAHIVYGRTGLSGPIKLTTGDEGFVGVDGYEVAGRMVACLGDLDGDGKDDFAIGAPRSGPKREGAVYVMYGRPRGGYGDKLLGLERADAVFRGALPHGGFGNALANVRDVDGDGKADLGIAAPDANTSAGRVYLFKGTGARLTGAHEVGEAFAVLVGKPGQRFGWSVASAGDFDGDGKADLVVGTSNVGPASKDPGAAYVFPGAALNGELDATKAISLVGEPGDSAGIGVAVLGDLNFDKYSDIAIGAVNADGDAPKAGKVYLVRGRASKAGDVVSLPKEYVVGQGTATGDYYGEVVRNAGDVDNDGFADLLIGARGVKGAAEKTGSVFVISGKGLGGK